MGVYLMPGISVCELDNAGGGILLPNMQQRFTYRGNPVAVVGTQVAPHGKHDRAVMIQGSAKMTIDGIPVVFAGCKASCDDEATGRLDMTVSG